MARFLAYTAPERGHLYPIVPTLLELRRRGHQVAVRTMSEELATLRGLGLDAGPVDPAIEARQPDDWQARTPVGAVRRDVRAIAERAEREIPDLRRAVTQTAPDAIFVDATSWGAAAAAEASGLPWAYAVHFCLPIPSPDAPPYGLGLPPRRGWRGRVRDELARRLVLEPLGRVAIPRLNRLRCPLGLPPVGGIAGFFLRPPLLVCYTAEPFEYPRRDWPDQVRMVGPGCWDPPAPPPDWLDGLAGPLVLVTCSSEFQNDARLAETALAAFTGREITLAVTTAGVDPGTLQAARPANAHIARFLPHAALLSQACCVVCHAGMGITQKALAAGVPVCAVPFGRDQFEVARRVQVAGAGSMLPASRLRPDRLRAAAEQATSCRAGAARIAAAFGAAGGPQAAAGALEQLAGGQHHDQAVRPPHRRDMR
jgi:UDP:flavonoid glycosyltransferase YjiC (YdhE family)